MKTRFLFLFCLGMMCCMSCQKKANETQRTVTKKQCPTLEDLCEVAWIDFGIPDEWPGDPYVGVLFFDIDNDGIPEALVTYRLWDLSGTGYNGWNWTGYVFKDGQWQTAGGDDVSSAWDGFHVLTEEGTKPKLIASTISLKKGDDKEDDEVSSDVFHVTLDREGRFKVIPLPDFTVKSPDDKFEPIPFEAVHQVEPLNKTVAWKYGESEHPKAAFVENYMWQTPVIALFKPDAIVTNTNTLLHHLQDTIIHKRSEVWWQHRHSPMYPETIEMFTLDLEGNDNPTFFVTTGKNDLSLNGDCYVVLRRTGPITYREIGRFGKEFIEFALHEKTNGLYSIECRYPFGRCWKDGCYIRDLYVFDGERYNITVRSWCKEEGRK